MVKFTVSDRKALLATLPSWLAWIPLPLFLLPPESAAKLVAGKKKVLETGDILHTTAGWSVKEKMVSYDLTIEPARDPSGAVIGISCASMDSLKKYLNPTVNWLLVSMLVSFLVSGCAAMGKKECLNAQWQSVGYEDGAKGYDASRIGEYRKSCAEYNVSPNLEEYTKGRFQGLAQWCTPSNGYYQGTRGAIYNGVCPEALESDFEFAMSEGRALYDYLKEINNHELLIARMYREYGAIDAQITVMEAELISNQVQPRRRRSLLNEIRAAERDQELLRYDISEAESALNEMHRNLHKMQAETLYK